MAKASVATYDPRRCSTLIASVVLPLAGLAFERRIALDGRSVIVMERVTNSTAARSADRLDAARHAGPALSREGRHAVRGSATRSQVIEGAFGPADYLCAGATFDWPMAPRIDGGVEDLRRYTAAPSSRPTPRISWTRHATRAFFVAFSPQAPAGLWIRVAAARLSLAGDLGREPRRARCHRGIGREVTRGMEFGVSPFPETRRAMIDRGGCSTFRPIAGLQPASTSPPRIMRAPS